MANNPITGHTRMGCLLGSPVAHSVSPMMHNLSFETLGLDCVYLCFDCDEKALPVMIPALRQMNVFGFNVTMPLKTAIIPYLDALSPEAEMSGAVNTVNNDNGVLIGYNTDGTGFLKAASEEGYDISGKEIVILGAGGAASAIAVQAALDGAKKVHLVCRKSRSWERAWALTSMITNRTACVADLTDLADTKKFADAAKDAVLLVNATPVGMEPDTQSSPVRDLSVLPKDIAVADIIYHPQQTKLLREAKEAGHNTFNGMYMLLYQGEKSFRIWTGQDMPVNLIRNTYFSA